MYKYLLMAALAGGAGVSSGCATEEPTSLTPPEPTKANTRWSSEYRTGSRLPLPDNRASSTVQPVYQFDAGEYERERVAGSTDRPNSFGGGGGR
jgi:hypothetical protein